MSEQALIVRDDAKLAISFTPAALEMKAEAMAISALVGTISNAAQNDAGVEAQIKLKEVIKLVELAEEQAKRPLNDFRATIIKTCRSFLEDVRDELRRISVEAGNFQQEEQKRARAAELARNMELSKLERERQAALAKAPNTEAMDAIDEHYNRKAQDVPLVEINRAEGQRISKDYDVTVLDVWALARANPFCVKIEPLIGQIKDLLRAGVTKIPGVAWKEVVRVDVRLTPKTKAIEV